MMDLRLKDHDLFLDSGVFSYVKGIEEAAQRAMERLRRQYPDSFAAVCGLCDGHKEI